MVPSSIEVASCAADSAFSLRPSSWPHAATGIRHTHASPANPHQPFLMGEKLVARAGSKDKRLCPVPGAEHWSVLADAALGQCHTEFFSRR